MVRYVKHTNNHIQAQGTVLQTIYIEATIILFWPIGGAVLKHRK